MSLAQLKQVLPLPKQPTCIPTGADWQSLSADLGAVVLDEQKQLLNSYGVGCIDGFIWIYSPGTTNPHLNLATQIHERIEGLHYLQDAGEQIPYALYPDPEGLIPWAGTDNGDTLHWILLGGEQRVVVQAARDPRWDEFPLSIAQFLTGLLTRRIKASMFPVDFPAEEHSFLSWSSESL